MSRPVRAWTGGHTCTRVHIPVSRLTRLAAAVVLLCALGPAISSARAGTTTHAARQSVNHRSPDHSDARGTRARATRARRTRARRTRAGRTSAPAVRSRTRDLQIGTGERSPHGSAAVRRLQRGLRRAGYAPGPVDGRYGPLTAAAVERFQLSHGLRVDGVVGPATRRVMSAHVMLSVGSGETDAHGSAAVAHLQVRLRHLGLRPGPVDGRFGPRTERAVLAFQRTRHLRVDGVVGPVTERALDLVARPRSRPVTTTRHGQAHRPRSTPVRVPPSAPRAHPRPARRVVGTTPSLPGLWILAGLGLLGVVAVLVGYRRTRRRIQVAGTSTDGPDSSVAEGGHRP